MLSSPIVLIVVLTGTTVVLVTLLLRRRDDRHREEPFSGLDYDVRPADDLPDRSSNLRSYLADSDLATLDVPVIAAFWYAGKIPNDRMPALAAELIERGFSSPHMAVIAVTVDPKITYADLSEDLDPAFRELGIDAPISVNAAQVIAARHLAREVIQGHLDAGRCASLITELFDWNIHSPAGRIVELHVYLRDWVRPNSPEEESTKAEIIAACREFLIAHEESRSTS